METHPGPGLGRALEIQRNKPPVCLGEPSQSWLDPDPFGPTDSSSTRPLLFKEGLLEICIPLPGSVVAKSRFLSQFQGNIQLSM